LDYLTRWQLQLQLLANRQAMRIDPLNKPFLALLLTVMLGTIAYFITSIFIDTVGDAKIIQHIEFEQSDFNIFIYQHKSDKRYEAQVYSGK